MYIYMTVSAHYFALNATETRKENKHIFGDTARELYTEYQYQWGIPIPIGNTNRELYRLS